MSDLRRLVVFRFDRDPVVCRSRVAALRALNPGVAVHGLYGGRRDGVRGAAYRVAGRRFLGLDSCYASTHPGAWNWRHADLALLEWHRAVGRHLAFDVVHLVEWDLLLTAPLAEVYAGVHPDSLGLTCPTAASDLEGSWSWLTGPAPLAEWHSLIEHARRYWGEVTDPMACLGVGPCLPRSFLESYANLEPTELCHDELRMPLAAASLGFTVADTGLRRSWFSTADDPYFRVGGAAISEDAIRSQTGLPGGRRAFHPVRAPMFAEPTRRGR